MSIVSAIRISKITALLLLLVGCGTSPKQATSSPASVKANPPKGSLADPIGYWVLGGEPTRGIGSSFGGLVEIDIRHDGTIVAGLASSPRPVGPKDLVHASKSIPSEWTLFFGTWSGEPSTLIVQWTKRVDGQGYASPGFETDSLSAHETAPTCTTKVFALMSRYHLANRSGEDDFSKLTLQSAVYEKVTSPPTFDEPFYLGGCPD